MEFFSLSLSWTHALEKESILRLQGLEHKSRLESFDSTRIPDTLLLWKIIPISIIIILKKNIATRRRYDNLTSVIFPNYITKCFFTNVQTESKFVNVSVS